LLFHVGYLFLKFFDCSLMRVVLFLENLGKEFFVYSELFDARFFLENLGLFFE
jgi:hypothetical protein